MSTPSDKVSSHDEATAYEWFFKDEKNVYIKYGETNASNRKRSATRASSDDLELAFTSGRDFFNIASNKHTYRVDFKNMVQVNQTTKVQRIVRRRPCVNKVSGSVASSVAPQRNGHTVKLTPKNQKFEWFFKDERNQWVKYGQMYNYYKF